MLTGQMSATPSGYKTEEVQHGSAVNGIKMSHITGNRNSQSTARQPTPAGIDREIARLKQDYAHRKSQTRPLSHSVATAYKLAIASCEKAKKSL